MLRLGLSWINHFDAAVVQFFDQFADKSTTFNLLVRDVGDSYLLKGGLFMAFFWWTWFRAKDDVTARRRYPPLRRAVDHRCPCRGRRGARAAARSAVSRSAALRGNEFRHADRRRSRESEPLELAAERSRGDVLRAVARGLVRSAHAGLSGRSMDFHRDLPAADLPRLPLRQRHRRGRYSRLGDDGGYSSLSPKLEAHRANRAMGGRSSRCVLWPRLLRDVRNDDPVLRHSRARERQHARGQGGADRPGLMRQVCAAATSLRTQSR